MPSHRSRVRLATASSRRLWAPLLSLTCVLTGVVTADVAQPVELDAPVVSATVFADRAEVVRSATVELKPGATRLVFRALPESASSSIF